MRYNPTIVTAYYRAEGLPEPVYEHRFHPARKWRMDIAWPDCLVAIEVQGAIFRGGRHTRGAGMAKDMEKFNAAQRMGWSLLLIQPNDVCMLDTVQLIKDTMEAKHQPTRRGAR